MLTQERLIKMSSNINLGLVCNIVIGILFILSKNSLREDFIIGFCSTLLFFFIYFSLKEFKAETLRQIRLRTKIVFRKQKLILKFYSFFFVKIVVIYLKFCKKLLTRYIFLKLVYQMNRMTCLKKFFLNKLLFFKIYFINLLQVVFNKIVVEFIKLNKIKIRKL